MNEMTLKTKVIGVDIALDYTNCAVVDLRGNIIAQNSFSTKDYPDISNFVSRLCEQIINIAEENGGFMNMRSVGISAPSSNYRTGSIENAANLPWKGVIPLSAILRDRLGMAVAVANDCHANALGEYAFGTAHGMTDFVVMTFKNGGVGSCIFTNGHPHLGADGFAGEIGHTCVEVDGRLCGCGHKGCLERYISVDGVVQTAKELMAQSDKPSLMRNIQDLTAPLVSMCCEKGDELALETYHRTGRVLGMAMANYASMLNPQAIVISGDIVPATKWLMPSMLASMEDHVFHNLKGKVRLLPSILDPKESDLLGAAALAWSVKEYSLFK